MIFPLEICSFLCILASQTITLLRFSSFSYSRHIYLILYYTIAYYRILIFIAKQIL